MSAQIDIPNLPTAAALTGTELVPVVQNGVTVHTTAGAIAVQPTQTQTFLTQTQEVSLANSRYLSSGTGISLVDGGAGSFFRVSLSGTALSLQNASTGIVVKDTAATVASRSIAASGAGLSVSDGDGVAGNPTVALSGLPATLANLTGAGFLVLRAGGTNINPRTILGTANQIVVTDGDGQASDPIIAIASNVVLPGTGAVQIPIGTNAQQPVGADGQIRFNSDTQTYDAYASGIWRQFSLSGGVTSFSAGTTGLTPSIATNGAVVLAGTLVVANGGTGAVTAAAARVNLLPAYAGNASKRLTLNAGATDVEWVADGNGTVTSVAALTLGTTGTDLSSTVANGSTTPVITLQVPTASATNRGALSSTDWSTFNNKQQAGAYLSAVDADAPLTGYGTSASHLSIPAATALVNGYLTSTDWGTFNSKQPAGAYLTAVTADSPIVGSGTSASHLSMPAASASVSGYLSSTDWSTFNGKQAAFGSQTANYIYAAPNGSAGTPSFRAMVVADVPTLNQNTSGTAAGLSGTPNISVGTIGASGSIGTLGNISASYSGVIGWAWSGTYYNALDVSIYGSVYSTNVAVGIAGNVYFNGADWNTKTQDKSTRFVLSGDTYTWYGAPAPIGLGNSTPIFATYATLSPTGLAVPVGISGGTF